MGTTGGYSWRVPENFKGRFQVQFEIDVGPFEVEQDQAWYIIDEDGNKVDFNGEP